MKKLNFILIFLAALTFSCSKDGTLGTGPVADQLSGNSALCVSGAVIKVNPGSDDTKALNDAFALAKTYGKNAVVKLMPGTFTIGMIEVREFNGTFCGSGMGKTIINNSPDITPDAVVALNKIPALITFIGGNVSVSDMTVEMPEALSWLDVNYEMSMFLFSDYSADFMPAKQHIGVNLNNIEVIGVLEKDVTMWDGTIIDYPYGNFDGARFSSDVWQSSTLLPLSNIDATVSNSKFTKFGRGVYVVGCKSGNFIFGPKGGNIIDGNFQGIVVNGNIGINVQATNNEITLTPYVWDGIDINTFDYGFEYVVEDLGTYAYRNNVFNCDYNTDAIGIMDYWRIQHPDNPVYLKLIVDQNTINDIGEEFSYEWGFVNAVFSNNKFIGNGPGYFELGGLDSPPYTPPLDPITLSTNCKLLNNLFLNKNYTLQLDPDSKDFLLVGDFSNITVTDNGVDNKIIGLHNPGHGFSKTWSDQRERIRARYNRH